MVTGRFLQGVGGGGLVPVTLALVADLYPVERRGVPLGVVGRSRSSAASSARCTARVVLAVGDWRDIFWINLAVGARARRRHRRLAGRCEAFAAPSHPRGDPTTSGMAPAAVTLVAGALVDAPADRRCSA